MADETPAPITAPTALPIEQIATELKAAAASPGYKTTEFWMHACIILALILSALAGSLDAKWAAVCISASASFYALSRGLSKQGNSH